MLNYDIDMLPLLVDIVKRKGGGEFLQRALKEPGVIPIRWLWNECTEEEKERWFSALCVSAGKS
jgi:hypothetical protein